MKNYSLSENTEKELAALAKECEIEKLILFGSRARGDSKPRSDIDLAVSGGNILKFKSEIDEKINTLLEFDVVCTEDNIQPKLRDAINNEGIVIYEKV